MKDFQSIVVPNSRTTFPIPFAFDIDSPRNCPGELELGVGTSDRGGVRTHDVDRVQDLTFGDMPLTGGKTIHLDQFESIPVWGSSY